MDFKRLVRNAVTSERNRSRIALTGLTPSGHKVCRPPEAQNLLVSHPDYDVALVLNPDPTRPAHYSKAGRMGITRPRFPWTSAEIWTVRHGFERLPKDALTAALPRRSWEAILRRGRAMGLRRPKPPLKATGSPLLDQMFQRSRDLDFTLSDLDHYGGKRGLFTRYRWRTHGVEVGTIARIARALGGRLRARWL